MQPTQFEDTPLKERLKKFSGICLALAFLISLSGLCGWSFDIRWLRRPLPQFVAINPLTAVLLLLAAVAQLLAIRRTRNNSAIVASIGMIITGTALAKLVDLFSPGIAPVDQLLFAQAVDQERIANLPNRMAPNTAFCFLWLGFATILQPLGQKGKFVPAQFALIPLVLAALLSILGYLYRVPKFYGIMNYIPMALHTAAGFLLLAIAHITATPQQGILRHFTTNLAGSRLARWLVPATIFAPILLGFLRLLIGWQYGVPVEFGVAILVLSIITILTLFVWFTTRALNLKDYEQNMVRAELAQVNAHLEKTVNERTAAALKTETRLRQVLDAMSEGFQIIGFDWRYLYVNDAVSRQAKVPKEVLLRSTFLELFPTSVNAELMEAFRRCFKNREALHMENRFVFPDGSDGWFDLHFQPVPEGLFILSSDITHRKLAEIEILKLNEELEEKIRARTAQLQEVNANLEHLAQERATLRTLTAYTQLLQRLSGTNLSEECKDILVVIEKKVEQMNQLISDLLAFSQLGSQKIHPAPIDMDLLVADVLRELFPEGIPANLVLNIDKLEAAYGDANLIQQVIVNLVSNAVKYSARQEQPTLKIHSSVVEGEVIFEIRDNGVGFDMTYADRLFGVFQRLHSSTDFEGTGVGLAIVQRIIHKHGGRVWAEAAPGKGARFYFTLPSVKVAKS